MSKRFSVQEWGSNPDEGNDDCWTGEDFDTIEEAMVAYDKPVTDRSTAFVTLDECIGREIGSKGQWVSIMSQVKIRHNPKFRPSRDDDSDWRNEIAMQAGMMGGCDAYNEVLGYD